MALLAYALCTVAEVEKQLGVTLSVNDTAVVEQMINATTTYIENYTGRHIVKRAAAETEYFDIKNSRKEIFLRNSPIDAITSVTEDPDADTPSVLTPTTDYFKDDAMGSLLRNNTSWFKGNGYRSVEVVYIGGYTAAPDDLKQVCIEIVSSLYLSRKRGDITSERVGQLQQNYAGNSGDISNLVSSKPYMIDILHAYKTNFI